MIFTDQTLIPIMTIVIIITYIPIAIRTQNNPLLLPNPILLFLFG